MPRLIVIGYDGSQDAQRAIDAAAILDADTAVIAHVWIPVPALASTTMPLGGAGIPIGLDQDSELEENACRIASEGVARAEAAGLRAEPVVLRGTTEGDTGRLLAELSAERDCDALVIGRRGLSRIEAMLLGSVSEAAVRAAHCPVLVVPGPEQ